MALLEEQPLSFAGFKDHVGTPTEIVPQSFWMEAEIIALRGEWPLSQIHHEKYDLVDLMRSQSTQLATLSFGRVLLLVNSFFSTSRPTVLGRRDGHLVPYPKSEEFEKRMNAQTLQPTGVRPGEKYAQSWSQLIDCLDQLLDESNGEIETHVLKQSFRARFGLELSETVFGHKNLSSLLSDKRLASKFFVASNKQCQTQIKEEKAGPSCLQQSSVPSTYREPKLQVLIRQRQALPSEIMLGDVTHENDNMFLGGSGQVNMKNVGTSTNSLKERWQGDMDDQHDEYLLLPSPSYESKLRERIYTIEEKQLRAKARQEAAAVQKHLRLKASSRNSIASVPSVSSVLPKSGPLHQAGTASLSCSYDFDSSFIGGIPCGMSSCVNESGAQRLFEHAEQSQSLRTEAAGADSECLPREIAPNAAEIDQPEAEPFPPQMA